MSFFHPPPPLTPPPQRSFACRIFDEDYGSFLKADYSIDCDGDEHALFQGYALVMILVYPVGIPLMCVLGESPFLLLLA